MALKLKSVPPQRGLHWVADALRLFARRPLALTLLFVVYFAVSTLAAALLPLLGSILQLMTWPMLSLGFMIATRSALDGGPVSPAQFIEPLRGDARARTVLLRMCVLFGLLAFALLALASWISGDALTRLQHLLAKGADSRDEIDALLGEPGVAAGIALLFGGALALSIPFWHAPALVHWGGQGLGQSLFSSTLAIWRNIGPFIVYLATLFALVLGASFGIAMLLATLGAERLGAVIVLPAGLLFSTVFYVSLLFMFDDSFTTSTPPEPWDEPVPPR
jgi:hypothetical protein